MRHSICFLAIIAVILLVCPGVLPVSATSGTSWTKSYPLTQGQGVMHEVLVDCGARFDLNSPIGAGFDLYALQNTGASGTCPSNEYIMSHATRVARSDSLGRCTMYLGSGLWCILVHARSGSGTYVLYVTRDCAGPTPTPTLTPTPTPWILPTKTVTPTPVPTPVPTPPCTTPYISSERSGTLVESQGAQYWYQIGGPRTYIEWILTGPCGSTVPGTLLTPLQATNLRKSLCGPDFNLYVYKDCDPRVPSMGTCAPVAVDTRRSSNAYVAVANPQQGSVYVALVYARESGGSYTLKTRSYQCQADEPIQM